MHKLFLALPSHPPTITVVSRHPSPDDGCGEVMTLRCTANQVENLFTPPTITWIAPNGREVPTGGSSNPRMNPQTRQLIFSDITTTNSGVYMCLAVVNIPEAQIVKYFDEAQMSINTLGVCLHMVSNLREHASGIYSNPSWTLLILDPLELPKAINYTYNIL